MDKKVDKIYALLDAGNYRQVITQCQGKEYENSDIAKALLVFAYAANRQATEALTVARGVITKNCTDDHVLATLSQGLKMIRKDTELIPCYENMLATHNFNEAGLLEIFTCYCRAGEHKKMQLISQKLYKATNKPCYMYWSVCCMVQQVIAIEGSGNKVAVSGEDSLATSSPTPFPISNNTMLVLGERMLKKLIYAPALPAPPATGGKAKAKATAAAAAPAAAPGIQQPGAEELQLYIDILLRQGKLEDALRAFLELHPSARANAVTVTAGPEPTAAAAPATELSLLAPSALNDDVDFKKRPSTILLQELVAKELHAGICAGLARSQPTYQHDIRRIYESVVYRDYPDQWDVHAKLIDQLKACARVPGEGGDEKSRYAALVAGHRAQLKALQVQVPQPASPLTLTQPASPEEEVGGKKAKKKKAASEAEATSTTPAVSAALNTRYRGPFLAEIHLLEALLADCGADGALPGGDWGDKVDLLRATPRYISKYDAVMKVASEPPAFLAMLTEIGAAPRSLYQEKLACLAQFICVFGEKQCVLGDIYPYLCSLAGGPGHNPALMERFLALVGAIGDDLLAKLNTISLESTGTSGVSGAAAAKKKKGKDAKQSLYPAPVVLSDADQRNADRRVLATGLSCMLAKCRQIEYIVASCRQVGAELVPAVQVQTMLDHYRHSLSLTLGGTGGEREVQAGDELLMLVCAQLQDFQQAAALQGRALEAQSRADGTGATSLACSAHPDHARYAELDRDRHESCLQWAELLNVGERTSPYNFVFHLERVELARSTSDVLAAVASFNQCRVKHVQLESMSYVLVPCLLEHGFFTEALVHNKSILHFHSSVQYDTGDQCCKAYSHANYMKCLEMNRFIELCKSSIQLALAKVECAALSVLEKHDSFAAMSDYLTSLMEGKLSESQNFIPASRAATELHDANLDYRILTRLDIRSMLRTGRDESSAGEESGGAVLEAMERAERRERRAEMARRLLVEQCRLQVLHLLLQISRDGGAKTRTLEEFTGLRTRCSDFLGQLPCEERGTGRGLEIRWRQDVDCGPPGCDDALETAYGQCVKFLLEAWHLVRGGAAAESGLGDAATGLGESIALLADYLHVGTAARGEKYAPTHGGVKTLVSSHVRALSGLVRTIAAWFPVILAQLCRAAPELCTTNCGASLLEARQAGLTICGFLNRVVASLDADLSELQGSEPTTDVINADARAAVLGGISKSQQISIRRLKQCIGNKMRDLNKLMGTA